MEYCTSLYQRPTDQQKRNIKAKAESASTLSSLDPKKRITLNYLCHGHERPRMGLIYSPLGAGTHATRPIRRSPWGHDAAWADQLSRTEARGPPSSWPLRRSRQSSELARSSRSRTLFFNASRPMVGGPQVHITWRHRMPNRRKKGTYCIFFFITSTSVPKTM